jgi:hypothetical protein
MDELYRNEREIVIAQQEAERTREAAAAMEAMGDAISSFGGKKESAPSDGGTIKLIKKEDN